MTNTSTTMTSNRIFVKGLPPNITEAEFRKHFSAKNREVTDVKLLPQRRIGFVGYRSSEDASQAIKYFNKSYIRLSRIGVEPARPIPILMEWKISDAGHGVDAVSASSLPKGQEGHETSSDKEPNSKKRKRELPAQTDGKLREFLQVMKTGRGGVSANESLVDVAANKQLEPDQHLVLKESASDDEYEQVPARKDKSRRLHSPTQGARVAPSSDGETLKIQPTADRGVVSDVGESRVEEGGAPAVNGTDDDWLRSRTSRLLDLVDPDDLATGAPPRLPSEPQPRDTESLEDTEHSVDQVASDPLGGGADAGPEITHDERVDTITKTARLFVRNLPYCATEADVRETFEKFGPLQEMLRYLMRQPYVTHEKNAAPRPAVQDHGKANVEYQVHLPVDGSGSRKGFGLVLFVSGSDAVRAFQTLDGAVFQGRIMHIIPASEKRETGLDEYGISKLSLRKQNLIRKKAGAASTRFNWNSLYMSQDAVNTSVAKRLGVSKSELLDATSADAGVRQAIAETSVIQETKAYFAANGVDLDAFKSGKRGDRTILVKNFPHGTTMEELRAMFEEHGSVVKVLMPPSGTIAIMQFAQAANGKAAFGKLAYRRIEDSILYLEKGPENVLRDEESDQWRGVGATTPARAGKAPKASGNELLSGSATAEEAETASLFIRNLSFDTSTRRLGETFEGLDGFVSALVKTKADPMKAGQRLSMGFGFAEFRSKEQAQAALKVMDGYTLDGHRLEVKASHKGRDAAEERRRDDAAKKAAGQRTKLVVKNLSFQATKKDVRLLLGTYGQLRSVRVPQKADHTTRGFAFADFVTAREAQNALEALRDTHLLGRRLVLDYAEAEAVDAEEEIEKMQRKVGRQVNTVALERLNGGGKRKKANIGKNGDGDEDDEAAAAAAVADG